MLNTRLIYSYKMDHLKKLNGDQIKAVTHTKGPLLIVAGAGAGKTKTIIHRIIHIIKDGVEPNKILAITFTNKAAKEMRERVLKALSSLNTYGDSSPFVSTFHSLGVHILRANGDLINLPKYFSILGRGDSLSLIKEALVQEGHDPKKNEPSKILSKISRQKGEMVTQQEYSEQTGDDYVRVLVSSVWKNYENLLEKNKALDFDDLLLKPVLLLKKYPEILEGYQKRWKYIHIDEYQDTNQVQYELARLLSQSHKNICVVGDADQNIYSWRGANIENILNFGKDYSGAKIVTLEENYRSTQTILSVANTVIKKNINRNDKNLFTKNQSGEAVTIYEAYNEADEARFVARKSLELINDGVSASNIGVLYRANFQSRVLEEAMLSIGTPHQVLGVRFFERKEIKDIISFIRASLNPDSLTDVKRIINTPKRGIGKVTIAKIFSNKKDELSPRIRASVDDFYNTLGRIKIECQKTTVSNLIKFTLSFSGYEKMLKEGSDDDLERLENVRELVTLARKYDKLDKETGIETFLTDVALLQDQDSLEVSSDCVKLMTVHAAKGLEFDYVFVVGLEQDLFPHIGYKTTNDRERAEEERRLFYVAITRARKKLFLTHASVRTIFGSQKLNTPSEFFVDIDDNLIEKEENTTKDTDLLDTTYIF